jgi:hypothetical protein
MPKLIDYPRTSYAGAWEVADVVDDTGGKCALETCARKLNRKVSGSFKAIIGSAVKFGLLSSKREMLTTTTLFRRIKHAYDKQEELVFHREAFLTPPLFTQLCRKFRSRELPVQMLDIMLIREFDVEEINAQGVSKAFIDGARMVGLLDERNMVADIDQLAAQQPPRRELASPELGANSFRAEVARANASSNAVTEPLFVSPDVTLGEHSPNATITRTAPQPESLPSIPISAPVPLRGQDAVASLFGIGSDVPAALPAPEGNEPDIPTPGKQMPLVAGTTSEATVTPKPNTPPVQSARNTPAISTPVSANEGFLAAPVPARVPGGFRIELSGPGLNTILDVQDEDDLALARFLLDKIGRQLKK